MNKFKKSKIQLNILKEKMSRENWYNRPLQLEVLKKGNPSPYSVYLVSNHKKLH